MPDDENESPAKQGLVMFGSFITFGAIPLISYIIVEAAADEPDDVIPFIIACILTAITMFVLGLVKVGFGIVGVSLLGRWWRLNAAGLPMGCGFCR